MITMAKRKEQIVTINHTEILGLAIQHLADIVQKEENMAKHFEDKDPQYAKEMREGSTLRKKFKMLLQMYKFETGNDYGFYFDLD
jgi:hypothetical protein